MEGRRQGRRKEVACRKMADELISPYFMRRFLSVCEMVLIAVTSSGAVGRGGGRRAVEKGWYRWADEIDIV